MGKSKTLKVHLLVFEWKLWLFFFFFVGALKNVENKNIEDLLCTYLQRMNKVKCLVKVFF